MELILQNHLIIMKLYLGQILKKPKFLNIVIKINTKKSPKEFIEIFKKIEKKLGRKKG